MTTETDATGVGIFFTAAVGHELDMRGDLKAASSTHGSQVVNLLTVRSTPSYPSN